MAVLLPGEKCKEKEDDNGRDGCGQPSTLERRMVFKPDRMASGCQSGADVQAVDQKDILPLSVDVNRPAFRVGNGHTQNFVAVC